jgi:hypothetical protein
MTFITGNRMELIEEYTKLKKFKGKFIIPIGPHQLYLKGTEYKISQKGNEMIVLSIGKKPEEVGDDKISFHGMTSYYTSNRLPELIRFMQDAFNFKLVYSAIQDIESILHAYRGKSFDAIISHQKRLLMKDGLPAERKYLQNMTQWGLPMIAYEPRLWKVGTTELQPEEHRLLIHDFNRDEKEMFNMTLLNRYNLLYGTIDD